MAWTTSVTSSGHLRTHPAAFARLTARVRVARATTAHAAVSTRSAVLDRTDSLQQGLPDQELQLLYVDELLEPHSSPAAPQALEHLFFPDYTSLTEDVKEEISTLNSLTEQLDLKVEEAQNLARSALAAPSAPQKSLEDAEAARQARKAKRAAKKGQPAGATLSPTQPNVAISNQQVSSGSHSTTSTRTASSASSSNINTSSRPQHDELQSAPEASSTPSVSSAAPEASSTPSVSSAAAYSSSTSSLRPSPASSAQSSAVATTPVSSSPRTPALQRTTILSFGATAAAAAAGGSQASTNGLSDEPPAQSAAKARHARRAAAYQKPVMVDGSTARAGISPGMQQGSGARTDTISLMMNRGASGSRLDSKSEGELAALVQDFLFLEQAAAHLRGVLKREPSLEEWAAAVKMDPRSFTTRMLCGQRAKQLMVQANHRLVVSICKKYLGKGMGMQDLIAVGIQGLVRGIERFDAGKGFKLSTYVHWWIRQALNQSLSEQGRMIRLPAGVYESFTRIQRARQQLTKPDGEEPLLSELAAACDLSEARVKELLALVKQAASLDVPVADDEEGGPAGDYLEDERDTALDVVQALDDSVLQAEVDRVLGELGEKEALVLRLRFGLDQGEERTLEEVGQMLKLTRERIRQIEAKAMRKMMGRSQRLDSLLSRWQLTLREEGEVLGRASRGTHKTK